MSQPKKILKKKISFFPRIKVHVNPTSEVLEYFCLVVQQRLTLFIISIFCLAYTYILFVE